MNKNLATAHYMQIELDWVSYYNSFKQAHGLWPVKYKGKLLFPDGWTYSATDMAGPEWPPPEDLAELWRLQYSYWYLRKRIVKHERDYLRVLVQNLRDLQQNKSQPLQERRIITDESTGKQSEEFRPVDVESIENGRLSWLAKDVDECDNHLQALRLSRPRVLDPVEESREVQDS